MKIVTYNLRSGGTTRLDNQWHHLNREFEPDIVFAQESLHPEKYFLPEQYREVRGCVHAHVPHGKWGSAILSSSHRLEPIELSRFGGWVVGARVPEFVVSGKITPVLAFSIHTPSPGPYEPALDAILDEIALVRDGSPMILAGDFNVTTALRHPLESATKNSAGERRILTRLRREFGLLNAWQTLHPNEDLPQTLRWSRDPVPPYHCDGIFVSHSLLPHVVSATVESDERWVGLSDHNPVVVTLA